MDDTNYIPVSCDLHSQYELAIMHNSKLELSWLEDNEPVTATVIPRDIQTRNHAEYLIAETLDGKKTEFRLDHITEMRILG